MAQLELVQADFGAPERQHRGTVAIRWILALPHWIVLYALGIATEVLVVLGWFAALVTGRFPAAFTPLVSGYIRYQTRVAAYAWLLHGAYPPFGWTEPYPVDVAIPTSPVRRLAVLFRIVLLVPAALVSGVVAVGMAAASLVIWLIVLVSGRMPPSLFDAMAAVLRYQARYSAYAFMLTAKYPGELFGDEPSGPAPVMGATGPAVQWGGRPPEALPAEPPDSAAPEPAPTPATAPDPQSPPPPPWAPPSAGVAPPPPPWAPPSAGAVSAPFVASRLVLGRAAKRILVVFVVLGILVCAAIAAVAAVGAASTSNYRSFVDAHNTLEGQLTAVERQRATCTLGQGPCLNQYWTQLTGAFEQFQTAVTGISVPASAQGEDAAVRNDTRGLITLLQQLSAEDPSAISESQLIQLQNLGTAFESDSRHLADALS